MKLFTFFLILISSFFLISCTPQVDPETTRRIQVLEQENSALKIENANLKVENDLLKAWGNPTSIQTSTSSLVSSDPQFIEWNYDSCMKEAFDIYVSQGSEYCKKKWYTPIDIATNKCQLEDAIMEQLNSTKTKAKWECDNLYK